MEFPLLSFSRIGAAALAMGLLATETSGQTYFTIGSGTRGRGALAFGKRLGPTSFQFGLHNNLDLSPLSVNPFSIVPPNVQPLGRYRIKPGGGFDALLHLGNDDRQGFFVGAGLYFATYDLIGISPLTRELYSLGTSDIVVNGAYSIGFSGITNRSGTFGILHHTQLGWGLFFGSSR